MITFPLYNGVDAGQTVFPLAKRPLKSEVPRCGSHSPNSCLSWREPSSYAVRSGQYGGRMPETYIGVDISKDSLDVAVDGSTTMLAYRR